MPQKTPRSTEYTEVNISPGRTIRKIGIQRSSANKKEKFLPKMKKKMQTGIATKTVAKSPAVITFGMRCFWPCALYFVISRETVIGVPEQVMVNKSAKTERATWYKPIPSEPIVLDR